MQPANWESRRVLLCFCRESVIVYVQTEFTSFKSSLPELLQTAYFFTLVYRIIEIVYVSCLHVHWFYFSTKCSSTLVFWVMWISACKSVRMSGSEMQIRLTSFFPFCLSAAAVVQVDGQPLRLQLCDTAGQVKTAPLPFVFEHTDECVISCQTVQTVQTCSQWLCQTAPECMCTLPVWGRSVHEGSSVFQLSILPGCQGHKKDVSQASRLWLRLGEAVYVSIEPELTLWWYLRSQRGKGAWILRYRLITRGVPVNSHSIESL